MRGQVDTRLRDACSKASKDRPEDFTPVTQFLDYYRRELMPGREDKVEALVDSVKVMIKDTHVDSPMKFYSLLVCFI